MSKVASSILKHINRSERKVTITQGLAKGHIGRGKTGQETKRNRDKKYIRKLFPYDICFTLSSLFLSFSFLFFLSHVTVFCEAVRILLPAKGGA